MADLPLIAAPGLGYLRVRQDSRGLAICVVGEFDLSNADSLRDCLMSWVLKGEAEAIIDLSQTRFIDSTVIGMLVATQLAGMALTLRGARGMVRRALETSGLDDVFKFED